MTQARGIQIVGELAQRFEAVYGELRAEDCSAAEAKAYPKRASRV